MIIKNLVFSLVLFAASTVTVKAQFGFTRIDTINVINGVNLDLAWTGGLDYPQYSNIDLNWDGIEDLFVFDRTCNKVLTFIHTGGVGVNYVYDPYYEQFFPKMMDWCLLVDYNCDGKKDIYTSNIGGVTVYRNVGNSSSGHAFVLEESVLYTFLTSGYTPLSVTGVDIPAIVDVDGDSDIDILSFNAGGDPAIEYNKNLSMELYGTCDSLVYEIKNRCWGRFSEDNGSGLIELYDTLAYPCNGTIPSPESSVNEVELRGERHSGSTVLALDMNNNGVLELVLGDNTPSNTHLALLWNDGTAPNTNSAIYSVDPLFPSNSVPASVSTLPAGYFVDINNDAKRDLVVAPALKIGSENRKGISYYQNTGADLAPVFNLSELGFMQNDMFDVGSVSYPVFFDHDSDGLMDLLVSAQGQFDPMTSNQISKISYYRNTGSATSPEFTFVTDDYQNISALGLGNSLCFYPTFGDLDNDGDMDMIMGEYTGYCYYMENTGGAGNNAIFNTYIILEDDAGVPIFEGTFVYPQLVDLDRDGDLDLVNGKRSGKLSYYKNVGNPSNMQLQEESLFVGGVDVSEWWTTEGYSIPQFLDIDNEYHLILGSKTGNLHYYNNIDGNLNGNWTLVDSTLDNINIGDKSAPAIYDLNGDNRAEMMVGNQRGGLALYKSAPLTDVRIDSKSPVEFSIYPNPADHSFTVSLNDPTGTYRIELRDLSGRLILVENLNSNQQSISVAGIAQGTYLLTLTNGIQMNVKKLSIQK